MTSFAVPSLLKSSAAALEKSWSGNARFRVAMSSQKVFLDSRLSRGPNADSTSAEWVSGGDMDAERVRSDTRSLSRVLKSLRSDFIALHE